ncbi:MAG: hypothetical protein LBC39_05605 [Methanobrevibacter sp.]|jgi:hypothetical protein|nr:hypothetical protein [Candidatus Methanovirga aequatorialis]
MNFKKISILLMFLCIVGLCIGSASAVNKKDSTLVGIVDQKWTVVSGMMVYINGNDVMRLPNKMIRLEVYDFGTGKLTYTESVYTDSDGVFEIPLTLSKGFNLILVHFDGDDSYNECDYNVATTFVN